MNTLSFESDILKRTDRYSDRFSLPDYIYNENGRFDRERTLALLLHEEYGELCADGISSHVTIERERTNRVYAGKAKKHIRFRFCFEKKGRFTSFPVDLFLPNTEVDCPLVVALDFSLDIERCYCPVEELMEANVSIARVLYTDITTDDNDFASGIAPLLIPDRNDPHAAGKLRLWAWAAEQIGRYMLTEQYVKTGALFVSGHSRLGKTALLTAALSPIFSGVHVNCSGCSGVAISREKKGETIEKICNRFPFWFAPCYQNYANRESEMPFDQHYLTALIAPRKLCVVTAEEDTWADTEAQYLSLEAASVIYHQNGVVGLDRSRGLLRTGMHSTEGNIKLILRKGPHYFSRDDWHFFVAYVLREDEMTREAK